MLVDKCRVIFQQSINNSYRFFVIFLNTLQFALKVWLLILIRSLIKCLLLFIVQSNILIKPIL